jgi:hypothetical protein
MACGNSLFVNLSQKEYAEQKWRGRQLSVIQSHTASLRYAQQRQRVQAVSHGALAEATVTARPPHGKAVRRRQRKPANASTFSRKQTLRQSTTPRDGSAKEVPTIPDLPEQEDLSFNDLNEIFQLNTEADDSGGVDVKLFPTTKELSGHLGTSTDNGFGMQARRAPEHASTSTSISTKQLNRARKRRKSMSKPSSHGICGKNYRTPPVNVAAHKSSSAIPPIHEIMSSWDPFLRLPLEMSEPDKGLLHFCELKGRRFCVGSADNM